MNIMYFPRYMSWWQNCTHTCIFNIFLKCMLVSSCLKNTDHSATIQIIIGLFISLKLTPLKILTSNSMNNYKGPKNVAFYWGKNRKIATFQHQHVSFSNQVGHKKIQNLYTIIIYSPEANMSNLMSNALFVEMPHIFSSDPCIALVIALFVTESGLNPECFEILTVPHGCTCYLGSW